MTRRDDSSFSSSLLLESCFQPGLAQPWASGPRATFTLPAPWADRHPLAGVPRRLLDRGTGHPPTRRCCGVSWAVSLERQEASLYLQKVSLFGEGLVHMQGASSPLLWPPGCGAGGAQLAPPLSRWPELGSGLQGQFLGRSLSLFNRGDRLGLP